MTSRPAPDPVRTTRLALTGVADALATLRRLDDDDLRARFEAEFGISAKGRSSQRLLRRLAWKLQAEHEGGLTPRALDRIAALEPVHRAPYPPRAPEPSTRATPITETPERDPRLPPPGTILRRAFKGTTHEILVGWNDFGWQGQSYPSLTALARAITGSRWNGFAFFDAALAEARETHR